MPAFAYQVRNKQGKKLKGVMEADSEKGIADHLTENGYLITKITLVQKVNFLRDQLSFSGRIPADDMTMFYFQLANMVEVGIPVVKALGTASDQLQNRSLQKIIQDLASRITGGESLSEAMAHHDRIFPFLYRSMIRVGETSGSLAEILRHVAELNEASDELRHQVRSALAYPIVLIFASIAVIIFMMVWIVPSFTVIFEKAGVPLPLPTRMVYSVSMFVKHQPYLLLGITAVLVIGSRFLIRIPRVKYRWDSFLLSIPSFGLLLRRVEVARWSRNMTLMISSGLPISQTLEIATGLTENLVFQEALQATYVHVQGGGKLADILQRSQVFPADVVQMVSTGESSGTLDKMLLKIAQFYDQLISRTIKKLTGMIEPVFILLMGFIVGIIMLSILLPIFDMLKIFSPS